ncbi:MAG: ABC transporter substrate-binding protein [Acetatifactor sp.]
MKKNLLKRVLAIGLTVAMTLSLAACGGDKDGEDGKPGSSSGKGDAANAALAKENVYRLDPLTIPNLVKEKNNNIYVMDLMQTDTDVYAIIQNSKYDEITYQDTTEYYLFDMKKDTKTVTNTKLTLPDAAGQVNGGEAPVEADTSAEEEAPAEEETGYSYEYIGYSNFFLNKDGSLVALKMHNRDAEVNGEYISERKNYLCRWNTDGSFVGEAELTELRADQENWTYVNNMAPAQDGTINMVVNTSEKQMLYIYGVDGQLKSTKEMPEELQQAFNYMDTSIKLPDGRLRLLYREESNWEKLHMGDVNFATGQIENVSDIPDTISRTWDYNFMGCGENVDLIYSTNTGLNSYKIGDTDVKPMANFINSDLYINNFSRMVELTPDSFLAFYSEDWESGLKAGIFTYVKPEDIVDKTVIVLATASGFDYRTKKRVVDFNTNNSDYRIVMKDYNQYATYDDWTAGVTKLNNDIIAGNMPDILYNTDYNSLPVDNYIAKGLLADIGKFIAEDPELSQVEFMQNAFDAYSVDGVLYQVVPSFQVVTMMAKKSLVGNLSTWNMKEMQKVVESMGPEVKAFNNMTRANFMDNVMRFCGNQFVDPKTGKCNFNTGDFISMLEYAKTLPEEINYDDEYWQNYDWEKEQCQYRENRTLLSYFYMYSFADLAREINGTFGEPVSFIGFPTESGKGSYLMCDGTYMISSKSKCPEGAWKYVRYYLTDEYQKDVWNMPVNKKMFMEKSKDALERPYWTDENGEKQYYDMTMTINGEEVIIDPLNQQQLDEVVNFITSVTNRYFMDSNVSNIITEEMGAYFSGQKTAQDVADVIQRRVQVYVEENR